MKLRLTFAGVILVAASSSFAQWSTPRDSDWAPFTNKGNIAGASGAGKTDFSAPVQPSAGGDSWGNAGLSKPGPTTQHCNPVPEPASMAALGLGAVGLLRRRKKRQSS
jgi:hypothetical protein